MSPAPAPPRLSRRRALAVVGLAGLAASTVAACSGSTADEGPDPLIPLAERARSDAALVAAAIAADPELGQRLEPVRAARADHATALQQEIDRLAGAATTTPAPTATAPAGATDLAAVRQAVDAAAKEATGIVGTSAVERVGLVGSVAACCTAYSAILAPPT